MKKKIAVLALASMLTGCNGFVRPIVNDDSYFPVFSGFPVPYFFMSSGTQWNNDYAVSVRHTPFVQDKAYECSTGCDIVFIRHKATKNIPQWREAIPMEKIMSKGQSPYLTGAEGEGTVFHAPFLNTSDNQLYSIHDAPIAKGMSGGPVVADSDGKIVGINVGIHSTTLNSEWKAHPGLKGARRISVFVPYEVILKEWKIFQSKR